MSSVHRQARSLQPVSYTHLDVYKRQEQMMCSAADGMNLEEKKLALVRAKIEKTAELTEDKEELERLKGCLLYTSRCV